MHFSYQKNLEVASQDFHDLGTKELRSKRYPVGPVSSQMRNIFEVISQILYRLVAGMVAHSFKT